MQGKSEKLIGSVLKDNPQHEAFVITKSGYDDSENLQLVKNGATWSEVIHPDFLVNRIAVSSSRLQRKLIDGFLLHSPESYLTPEDIEPFPDGFYAGIKKAFEFLEEQVFNGTIRYYGISSNTFHLSTDNVDTINLHKILSIANEISSTNHFKLIEFPFNLVETGALTRHHGQTSLVELARENDLVTFTNRPLNAKDAAGAIRLALSEDHRELLDYEADQRPWQDSLALMRKQLMKLGVSDDLMVFPIIKHLNESWMQFGNPDAVMQIFRNYFHPFLYRIYEEDIPSHDLNVYVGFYEEAILCSKKNMTERTLDFRNKLITEGVIGKDDERSLPLIACEVYLNSNINHVLMGMRQIKYVDMMKSLF
jgi:aryl-alcohol dehydrogenase-like predicted oxidoreductase